MKKEEGYIQQLANYIKKNIKKGYTKDSLKYALIKQGHSKLEIQKALTLAEEDLSHEAPVMKSKPEIKMEVIEPKNAVIRKKSFWSRLFGK
jgi:SOS response regulatory protein OraA/RecX